MTTFVLVHGAWHGGWCWRETAGRLRQAGHEVYTPTLTGLADRAHLIGAVTGVATHVADVVGLLRYEQLEQVVLVGHSYGGNVITGAGDAEPGRLKALVYLDATIPSISEPLPTPPESADLGIPAPSGEFFGLPPRFWPLVEPRMTPQPKTCRTQPYEATGVAWTVPRLAYMATPNWQGGERNLRTVERLKALPRWEVSVYPWAHEMMIEEPEALADYLLQFA